MSTFEEKIARVCHEANRGLQAAYPAEGVPVAAPWDELDPATQRGIVAGVVGVCEGKTPEESHEAWCEHKRAEGWIYGEAKDAEAKTHPCLVPYGDLAFENAVKDHLFGAIVKVLAEPTIGVINPPSVIERIADLDAEIRAKQAAGWGDPRELALALTHLEDCQMRFTRGRAKASGVFRPVDLERVEARDGRARFEAEAAEAAKP